MIITRFCDARPSFPYQIESIFRRVKAMLIVAKSKAGYSFPLSADSLFCDLSPKSLEFLNSLKRTKRFRKSAVVYAAGEMPRCIYVLLKGRLQLRLNNSSVVQLIEPFGIFGLTETIANVPYETNAETITSCLCEYIKREDFIRFLQDEPEICFRLTQRLALNLQKTINSFVLQ